MRLLGFAMALAWLPMFSEASNGPKWVVASLLIPLLIRPQIVMTKAHWTGLALLAWSSVSLLWAVSLYDGINQFWKYVVLGGAFMVGSQRDVRPALRWFAVGMAINTALAVAQHFGVLGSLSVAGYAGLLMNKNYLAEAGLMATVAALVAGPKWLAVPGLIAWILPLSKSAIVAGGIAFGCLLFKVRKRLAIAVVVLALTIGGAMLWRFVDLHGFWDRSPGGRLAMAANTVAAIYDQPWGHGVGSFWSAYPLYHDRVLPSGQGVYLATVRPRTAHSDILTTGFELGLPGLLLLGLLFTFALRSREPAKYVVLAFGALGLFAFPLYVPHTAIMAALVAGYVCRGRRAVRGLPNSRRAHLYTRHAHAGRAPQGHAVPGSGGAVPT